MVRHKAQDAASRPRTDDVKVQEDIDFKSMLLPKPILKGLEHCRYLKPSPIQKKAIPLVRCGFDLIVQSKAGTGKTCVFTVAAMEMVKPDVPNLQAVVLAPTREVALQITDVMTSIGSAITGLKVRCFIGGYPLETDKKHAAGCHIAVGAPGRMRHLLDENILRGERVRLFVLDEADKLMEKAFRKDINVIFSKLPVSKQVLALSATFTPELVNFLNRYMNHSQFVAPPLPNGVSTTLLIGIRQFVSVLPHHVNKLAALKMKDRQLLTLLRSVPFNQSLVFSNLHSRAESICEMLRKKGFGVEWIAGRQEQASRVLALSQLKEQKVRVLVTTDLTARGIDIDNVNLIINLDLPVDHQTYLHRMGRAGRYGSHGMVISIASGDKELIKLQAMLGQIGGSSLAINRVPENLKNVDLWTIPDESLGQVFGIVQQEEDEQSSSFSSTDTDEKFSQDSSDTESEQETPSTNPVMKKCDSDRTSSDHTDTDEKLSRESSDCENGVETQRTSSVVNSYNSDRISNEGKCRCQLFDVVSDDIELTSVPCLFSSAEKESHWLDVSPVTVNQFRLPLNVPVTLIGSKFVRVKNLDNKQDHLKTEKNHSSDQLLNPESNVVKVESNYSLTNFERDTHIDLGRKGHKIENILSFNDIKEILENGVSESYTNTESDIEKENCVIRYKAIEERLLKYAKSTHTNYLGAFDSFDIIGWMAIDGNDKILDSLKLDQNHTYQFNLIHCPSGKTNIKVVGSFNDLKTEDHKYEKSVTTFKLERLNLVLPTHLTEIAEKLKPLLPSSPAKNKEETCLHNNTLDKKSGKIKCVSKTNTKRSKQFELKENVCNNSSQLKEGFKEINNRVNQNKSRSLDCVHNKEGKKGFVNTAKGLKSNDVQKENTNHIGKETKSKNKQKYPLYSEAKSKTDFKPKAPSMNDPPIWIPRHSSHTEHMPKEDVLSDSSSESCFEENLVKRSFPHSSLLKEQKSRDSMKKLTKSTASNNYQNTFNGSKTSNNYKHLSNALQKQLSSQDIEHSGSESSFASEVLQFPKPNHLFADPVGDPLSSDSTSECSYQIGEKSKKEGLSITLTRNCENKGKAHHSQKHKSNARSSKENHDLTKNIAFVTQQNNNGPEIASPSAALPPSKISYRSGRHDKPETRLDPARAFYSQYLHRQNTSMSHPYQGYSRQQHFPQSMSTSFERNRESPRILTSYNLFSDWYSTWYAEMHRQARQIEYMEYIRIMTTHP